MGTCTLAFFLPSSKSIQNSNITKQNEENNTHTHTHTRIVIHTYKHARKGRTRKSKEYEKRVSFSSFSFFLYVALDKLSLSLLIWFVGFFFYLDNWPNLIYFKEFHFNKFNFLFDSIVSLLLSLLLLFVCFSRGVSIKRKREREKKKRKSWWRSITQQELLPCSFSPPFSNINPIDTILYTNTTSTIHFFYHRHLSNDKYKKKTREHKKKKKKKNIRNGYNYLIVFEIF